MRSGANSVQHLLTPAALAVLKHAVNEARRRGHPQVQPLHVVSMLLMHAGSRLRQACMLSHPQNAQTAECRALEVCFNVALDHLPQSALTATSPPILSNALMAALKRAHAHQRRGCPEHQQSPLLAVKVEIDQLIISILDDPSVSRVMKEAGFSSTNVKFNLEDAPAVVTLASGGVQMLSGHEQQPSQAGPSYSSNGVAHDVNESKGSMKYSPVVAVNQANSMSSWQSTQGSKESHERRDLIFKASNRGNKIVGPGVGLPSGEDALSILEIFLRSKNRNAIVVGETTAAANSVVKDMSVRIKNGNVPAQLQGLQFLDPQLSSSSFGYCSSLEMEQKLAELSKIVAECMPHGAILHIGDLQWLAESTQLKKGPSNFCPATSTATVLRQMLVRHANEKLWFVGVATPPIFARLQALHPSLTSDWGFQPVQIASMSEPTQSACLNRFVNNYHHGNDLPAVSAPSSRGLSPIMMSGVPDTRHLGNSGISDNYQCCSECQGKFDEERRLLHENESLSLQLAPAKWILHTNDETPFGGVNGAMSQVNNQSVVQQLSQLWQKWKMTCRMVHGVPTQARLQPQFASSHSRPCGPSLAVPSRWAGMDNRQGASAADQPLQTSPNMPINALNTSKRGPVSPLQRSAMQVQDAVPSVGVTKSPEVACALELASPKDRSSVSSESDDSPSSTGASASQGPSLAPIQTTLALGRENDACSPLMAGKLRAGLKSALSQPSPLQSGASPMSLKNSSKPLWLTQSPLQRRPAASQGTGLLWQSSAVASASPLARRQAPVAKSPSPPPASTFKEVTVDDNLKGLYKGLMQRVPWQAGAVAGISATVMKNRSGMGIFRGATAKTDTWLLLLGPDLVAKVAIAKALAEMVFGGERSLLHLGFADGSPARLDADDNGMRYRGPSPVDRLAEAVRMKPSSVILLEDIDKANSVARASIVRAMERGKLADSNGREVSFSNTIVVMTTSVGSEDFEPTPRSGTLSFSEGKLADMGRLSGIRATIKNSSSEKIVMQGLYSKIAVVHHGERQQNESVAANASLSLEVPFWVTKRKPDSLLQGELRPKSDGKRTKSGDGRFLNLDLNLATRDTTADDECTKECDDEEAKRDKVLAKARYLLSDKFCALPDYAVGFDCYDFNGLATEVLNKLGKTFETHAPGEVGVEVDLRLLEHIISCVWKTPGGRQVFNMWVDDVFAKSISRSCADARICGGSVVEFVAELPEARDAAEGVVLPYNISFTSTLAV